MSQRRSQFVSGDKLPALASAQCLEIRKFFYKQKIDKVDKKSSWSQSPDPRASNALEKSRFQAIMMLIGELKKDQQKNLFVEKKADQLESDGD